MTTEQDMKTPARPQQGKPRDRNTSHLIYWALAGLTAFAFLLAATENHAPRSKSLSAAIEATFDE